MSTRSLSTAANLGAGTVSATSLDHGNSAQSLTSTLQPSLSSTNTNLNNNSIIVRVSLPGDSTTHVQVTEDMTVQEVLVLIAQRKMLNADNHSIYVKLKNFDGEIVALPTMAFRVYAVQELRVGVKVSEAAPQFHAAEQYVARRRKSSARRRNTIMNAPKTESVAVATQFPVTVVNSNNSNNVTSPAEQQPQLPPPLITLDQQQPTTPIKSRQRSATTTRERSGSFAQKIRPLSVFIGKKVDDAIRTISSHGALPALADSEATDPISSPGTPSPGANSPSPSRPTRSGSSRREIVDISHDGAIGDSAHSSSTSLDTGETSPSGQIMHAFAALSTDVAATNVHFTRRSRTSQADVSSPAPMSPKVGLLKRNDIRGRSVSDQGSLRDLLSAGKAGVGAGAANKESKEPSTPAADSILVRLHVNTDMTTIKLPVLFCMEDLLKFACEKYSLDFDAHTIYFLDGTDAPMDRTIQYFQQHRPGLAEFRVAPGQKTFSTHTVMEDGKEVMILQITKTSTLVMASTPEKLIERATDDSEKDMGYVDTLLMTFRSFMKPVDFFDELVSRFNCELPANPTPEDVEFYEKHKGVTQLKSVLVLRWWAEYHWHDFSQSASLKQDLCDFIDMLATCSDQFQEHVAFLRKTVRSQTALDEERMDMRATSATRRKTMESMFDELEVSTLAEQICLHDFELFKDVHPIEYLNQIWRKADDTEFPTPNLDFFSGRFDKETYWCATEILAHKDIKKRITVLRKFIQLAKELQERGNFFSMFSIYVGLNVTPVQRLKKTWEGIGQKSKQTFDEVEKMCDPSKNMKNYRDILAITSPPILPFLPIYMKDLTFMNDGNPSKFHGLLNFDKLRMMAARVHDITKLYAVSYKFKKISAIQNYLQKPHVEMNLVKLKEESLKCEPPTS